MKKIFYLILLSLLFIPKVNAATGILQYAYSFGQDTSVSCVGNTCVRNDITKLNLTHQSFYRFNMTTKTILPNITWAYDVTLPNNLKDYKGFTITVGSAFMNVSNIQIYNLGINCTTTSSDFTITTTEFTSNFKTFYCDIEGNNFTQTSTAIAFYLSGNTTSDNNIIYLQDFMTFYPKSYSDNNIAGAIENQTEEIQKSIDEQKKQQEETNKQLGDLNDNLTSNDVDMDGANSFFGDFSDTDHGGISGVITAPLRFINKLTGTCSPMSLDVLGANVELPCGTTLFWDKPEVANFRLVWNVLLGGTILYALLCKLFKVIEGLKNPDDSRIEVMKL